MRYIRARESNGAVVVSSRPIARRLSALAVTFASACVPTADLSSYSNAASNATADLGGDRTPPPTRPSNPSGADPEPASDPGGSSGAGEAIPGSGVMLDSNGAGESPSSSPSVEDGDPPVNGDDSLSDAGARSDAGAPAEPTPVPPPDADPPRPLVCSAGEATGPNGHCYVLVATPFDWDAARANCQLRGVGWDLTSIRSSRDSAFVLSLLDGETWVGGSDSASEETWAWVDDGFEFWEGEGEDGQPLNGAFVNWFDDEPNGSTSSQCMRLLADSRWADLECAELRPSLCEGPKH
ncbi:MAG TPA: C-type lectin domain-containing protein [Polyangiaceae bacterium]|nr:C-type lectin domain-containing protein [Polyangiaceae bacterium]